MYTSSNYSAAIKGYEFKNKTYRGLWVLVRLDSTESSAPSLPSLNSFTPLPRPRINSGIFLPPKSKSTTTKIIMISGVPRAANIVVFNIIVGLIYFSVSEGTVLSVSGVTVSTSGADDDAVAGFAAA